MYRITSPPSLIRLDCDLYQDYVSCTALRVSGSVGEVMGSSGR